ncbi:MAG: hypothetical protein D4R63_06195 [Methylococcaceae bacterium]|nr:MAG: hypothetical protein D4R63_06195 [Methylococcaceae bacterium]
MAINALNGINHGIASAIETESGITPLQVCCMIELARDALFSCVEKFVVCFFNVYPALSAKPRRSGRGCKDALDFDFACQ